MTEIKKTEDEMTAEEMLADTTKSVEERTFDEKEKRDAIAKAEKEANVFKGPPPLSRTDELKAIEEKIADKAKDSENKECPECGGELIFNIGSRRMGTKRGVTALVGSVRCSGDTCNYSGKYRRNI